MGGMERWGAGSTPSSGKCAQLLKFSVEKKERKKENGPITIHMLVSMVLQPCFFSKFLPSVILKVIYSLLYEIPYFEVILSDFFFCHFLADLDTLDNNWSSKLLKPQYPSAEGKFPPPKLCWGAGGRAGPDTAQTPTVSPRAVL